jgi:hypothetical protein
MSAKTAAVLDRAADIIERNGHCKGFYYDASVDLSPAECPVCPLGALALAMGATNPKTDRAFGSPAEIALERYLDIVSVADWNDAPDRTPAEVIAALRGAAQAEREAAL